MEKPKISELIEELEKIKQKEGNIICVTYFNYINNTFSVNVSENFLRKPFLTKKGELDKRSINKLHLWYAGDKEENKGEKIVVLF